MSARYEDLLPGVEGPPLNGFRAEEIRQELRTARNRAAVEDLLDCAVLIVVNLTFLLWPNAQIPFLGRDATLFVLLAVNAFTVVSYVRHRLYPRWKASRISRSWSEGEKKRIHATRPSKAV
ncbi:MAG: hypothetical protein ABR517_08820 [Thermoanaerobaculia bacterium]